MLHCYIAYRQKFNELFFFYTSLDVSECKWMYRDFNYKNIILLKERISELKNTFLTVL